MGKVTETAWELDFWDDKITPAQFVSRLNEAYGGIPVECLDTARLEMDRGGYDESAYVRIVYERPETEEEIARREAYFARYAAEREERDRQTYLALKRKYEGA